MRRAIVVTVLIVLILGLAAPAWAQGAQTTEAFVVLSGRADVPQGQTVGDLVVFHGSATVDGTVDGSLTAFDAPVTISGRVNGDVVVFNGRVELQSGANVTGDVVSQQAPVVASGATIGGTTKRVQTNTNWEGFGWAGKLAWWLAVSVSTLVVGLVLVWLVGRGAAWILEAGRTSIGPAIGWGLLVFFGLPILAILALVTLVGIPLGLGVLAALGRSMPLGTAPPPGSLAGGSCVSRPPGSLPSWSAGASCGSWPWFPSSVAWSGSPRSCSASARCWWPSGGPGPPAAPPQQPPDRADHDHPASQHQADRHGQLPRADAGRALALRWLLAVHRSSASRAAALAVPSSAAQGGGEILLARSTTSGPRRQEPSMEQQAREQAFISALTTEQFVLQAARSANVGEMTGRGTVYMGAVSSSLIALGFLAQVVTPPRPICRCGAAGRVSPGRVHLRRLGPQHPGEPGVVGADAADPRLLRHLGPPGRPVLRPSRRGGAVLGCDGHRGAAGPAGRDAVHRGECACRDQQHGGRGRLGPAGGQGREPGDRRRVGGRGRRGRGAVRAAPAVPAAASRAAGPAITGRGIIGLVVEVDADRDPAGSGRGWVRTNDTCRVKTSPNRDAPTAPSCLATRRRSSDCLIAKGNTVLGIAWRGVRAGRLLAGGQSALNHREQLQGSLDALQRMDAAVLQGDIGSNDQVAHGPGGGTCQRF